MAKKQSGLGRGLDALFLDNAIESRSGNGEHTITNIKVSIIDPKSDQPRKTFDKEALEQLAQSIKENGLLQPILVRERKEGRYQIIAGERRFRASKLAGLAEIPCIILDKDDKSTAEIALIENIQREDLNAIEIALAYEHLLEQTGMTQEKVSERVGKSRTAIANYLRLLKLPAQVQMALQKKEIDMGHARALLALNSPSLQLKVFKEILKNGWSVRKVEEIAQHLKNGDDIEDGKKKIVAKPQLPEEFNQLKDRLSSFLQTKVQMTCSSKGKGKISIPFNNADELERIMMIFDQIKQQ